MLVLSRKPNQTLNIGDSISIKVVRVKGNSIQLGIEAPREVKIVRNELLGNEQAADGNASDVDSRHANSKSRDSSSPRGEDDDDDSEVGKTSRRFATITGLATQSSLRHRHSMSPLHSSCGDRW